VREENEIEDLVEEGLMELLLRPAEGPLPRYSICPAYKDPRDGAIRADNILFPFTLPDLEAEWHCLKDTGDSCD